MGQSISLSAKMFSKAVLKRRWLLEHKNLSKVGKYTGKIFNSGSQISEMGEFFEFSFLDFADLLDFSASNIWILSRKNGSMCHLHFKMAFEKIGPSY